MKLPKLVRSKPAVKKADPGDGKAVKQAQKPTGNTSQSGFDTTKRPGPKRNISKEIKNHKRAFDYLIIVTESGPCFVVDGEVKAEKAAKAEKKSTGLTERERYLAEKRKKKE